MLFNSLQYLIFFPVVVLFYFAIPYNKRWILLLLSSLYFYMCWKPEYVIILIISILINYYAAIQMSKHKTVRKRKYYLFLSLVTNIGFLFMFKYYNFLGGSINEFLNSYNIMYNIPSFKLLLPVGISFYTFQTMGYSIDVFKNKTKPEEHLGIFAVYVSFFPQLISGPIERSGSLLPQFRKNFDPEYYSITDGLKLMLWGFFKKIVIADRLAVIVNNVFDNVHGHDSLSLMITTFIFAIQIYCDFSGYSDIAIGSAQVMGYKLMNNFKRPYHSENIAEFWRRWHISLTTWFRDYVFLPLSYSVSRKLPSEKYSGIKTEYIIYSYSTILTFLLSGIWHGANWTFFLWGSLHGFYLIFGKLTRKYRKKISFFIFKNNYSTLRKYSNIFITFTLVCFAWIFFRANNLSDSIFIIKTILTGSGFHFSFVYYKETILSLGLEMYELVIAIISLIILETFSILQGRYSIRIALRNKPVALRWSIYFSLLTIVLLWGYSSSQAEFIYFQF